MLGVSSRDWGVHSYSASSKKSLSLEEMIALIRFVARIKVCEKLAVAERRIVPPRCEDLRSLSENDRPEAAWHLPDTGDFALKLRTSYLKMLKIGDQQCNLR
jgi:hypothetical protein